MSDGEEDEIQPLHPVGQRREAISTGGPDNKRSRLSESSRSRSSAGKPLDLAEAVRTAMGSSTGTPGNTGHPASPSPSSALGAELRELALTSGKPQVDTDHSRLLLLQSVLRLAGVKERPDSFDEAVSLVRVLNESQKQPCSAKVTGVPSSQPVRPESTRKEASTPSSSSASSHGANRQKKIALLPLEESETAPKGSAKASASADNAASTSMPSSAKPPSLPGNNSNNGASTKSLPVASEDDAPAIDEAEGYIEE